MRFFADLHIHSRYSIATSRSISPAVLAQWAQLKGVSVLGTGDCTHPEWLRELRTELRCAGNGLFALKAPGADEIPERCRRDVFFMLTGEISCIYRKHDRTRKNHSLVFAPDFTAAEKLNAALSKIGNLRGDGRPILGLDAKDLLEIVLGIPGCMLIPAHAWTPHFSVFGSRSGFDSLEECYGELACHIHAIETGLSSDPAMNWRVSALDRLTLISNSDAHSPEKIGREATIIDAAVSYNGIAQAVKTGEGVAGTVEFFPEEGKYHLDGHRDCGVSLRPAESKMAGGLCPACGKPLTIGVLHRVEDLSDREEGARSPRAKPFFPTIPLVEILAEILGAGPATKGVKKQYASLLESLGSELAILVDMPEEEIAAVSPRLAEAVGRMRAGQAAATGGFDGQYGSVRVFDDSISTS